MKESKIMLDSIYRSYGSCPVEKFYDSELIQTPMKIILEVQAII